LRRAFTHDRSIFADRSIIVHTRGVSEFGLSRIRTKFVLGLLTVITALTGEAVGGQSSKLPNWVTAKPTSQTQTQTTAEVRGVNPCMTPDPGFGVYGQWHRDVRFGQYLRPVRGGLRRDGSFDVMFHFHGHEPVRKEWVKAMSGAVFASVDLGIGSGPYETTFQDPSAFEEYLHSVEAAMAKATGNPKAHARHIGLSAWSAGYGAVLRILEQPLGRRVDTVILLDGLHAGYVDGHVNDLQIRSVVDFARNASRGKGLFFVSHSSIIPPGYASTTETANWLVWSVNGKPRALRAKRRAALGLDLISLYDRGGFHARGYSGNDKMDHCAQIGLYPEVLRLQVKPRWKSPQGRAQ
jgi:hypothetical protein